MDVIGMFCGNCGSADQSDRFCSNCGQPTNSSSKPITPIRFDTTLGNQPSATPGFVLSLAGLCIVSVPILCLSLSITGVVMSRRARNSRFEGQHGYKLAIAGVVIGVIAISITSLFMLLAIPGAWQHNFG